MNQDERRKKIVSLLAQAATEGGWSEKASKSLGSTKAAVDRDLAALASGELPAGETDGDPEQHALLAAQIFKTKTDDDADKAMIALASGVIGGGIDPKRASVANTILVGRRFFVGKGDGNTKGGGGAITAIPGSALGLGH